MPRVIIIASSKGALGGLNISPPTYCPFPFALTIIKSKG